MRKLGIGTKEKPKNKEQHDEQVKAGLQYLHQQEKAMDKDGDKSLVRVKGPHANIYIKNKKRTEAKFSLNSAGVATWERFGDMKNASKSDLKIAQKHVDQLHKHPDIMSQTKAQITLAIKDFEIILKTQRLLKILENLLSVELLNLEQC